MKGFIFGLFAFACIGALSLTYAATVTATTSIHPTSIAPGQSSTLFVDLTFTPDAGDTFDHWVTYFDFFSGDGQHTAPSIYSGTNPDSFEQTFVYSAAGTFQPSYRLSVDAYEIAGGTGGTNEIFFNLGRHPFDQSITVANPPVATTPPSCQFNTPSLGPRRAWYHELAWQAEESGGNGDHLIARLREAVDSLERAPQWLLAQKSSEAALAASSPRTARSLRPGGSAPSPRARPASPGPTPRWPISPAP